jgi:hypothetical protein
MADERCTEEVLVVNCVERMMPALIAMKPVAVFLIAAGVSISAYAQATSESEHSITAACKIRFAIYQSNPHIPGGIAPGMSKEQRKWYEQNRQKFPAVCLDGDKPDYIVVWSSRFSSAGAPEPVINFGAITGHAGGLPIDASESDVSSPLASEYVYLSIFRAADVNHAQKDKSYQPMPIYYTQHDSWWTYRKSHHKAIEGALKFLVEEHSR